MHSFGGTVSTYANTITYNITVTKDSSAAKKDDNKSLKVKKDGGNKYESCFYVSPKYFSNSVAKCSYILLRLNTLKE